MDDDTKLLMLLHILIVGPYLIFIGKYKPNQKYHYYILVLFSLYLVYEILWHYIYENKMSAWLIIHITLFSGLLSYVGVLCVLDIKIPDYLYSFLIAIGAGAIGYYLLKLL